MPDAPVVPVVPVVAGAEEDVVYGLLTLAGMDVALPLAALREVVPCPPQLAGLPVAATGLLGAMGLRSLVLPVVDLRPALRLPAGRAADQVVVVVAHGGQVLGLLADRVRGVTRVPSSALQTMSLQASSPSGADGMDGMDGGGLVLSHAFQGPGGEVVSVLDAAAVLRRPGVPTVADVEHGAGTPRGTTASTATSTATSSTAARTLTLVRCGPHVLALDVAQVHTTLPSSATRPSVVDSALCRGVLDLAGREVPVADPLALLGLGALPAGDTGAGLVLDLGTGYVVLALTALLDLVELAGDDVLPLPAFAVPHPALLAGMADVDGPGPCLVLDGPALLADPRLIALAAVNTVLDGAAGPDALPAASGAPAAGDAGGAAGRGRPYVTYTAGVDAATPLDQVVEILPHPATTTVTTTGGALLGVVVHRRAAVPVLSLATLLGRAAGPVTAASCVLLVESQGRHVAFAVDALSAIEPLTWSDPDAAPRGATSDPGRALRSAPLVQVGGTSRLLPDLDLRALARAVHESGATGTAAGAQRVPHPTASLDDALGSRQPSS